MTANVFVDDIDSFKRDLAHQFAGIRSEKKKTSLSNNLEKQMNDFDAGNLEKPSPNQARKIESKFKAIPVVVNLELANRDTVVLHRTTLIPFFQSFGEGYFGLLPFGALRLLNNFYLRFVGQIVFAVQYIKYVEEIITVEKILPVVPKQISCPILSYLLKDFCRLGVRE